MAFAIFQNSQNEELQRYVSDEVFASKEEALEIIKKLRSCYQCQSGPFVYALLLKESRVNIGYVQLIKLDEQNWEVGYSIAPVYRSHGYATEALSAYLGYIRQNLNIVNLWGLCHPDNIASHKVLLKTGFVLQETGLMKFQGKIQKVKKFRWFKG